ncbi:MAG TPA: vanadium-dependent haloperoxidase [Chryseolinea sp.]
MRTCVALVVMACLLLVFQTCSDNDVNPRPINEADKGLPARWADVTLRTVQFTFPNSPTYTSRNLGYIGLTMYESVLHGNSTLNSVANELNGSPSLPLPQAGMEYNWALSLNAGQSSILKSLYPHAQSDIVALIDSLELATYNEEIKTTPMEVADRSIEYGRSIAASIYEWSKADGGHEGYLHHFDPDYIFPAGDGYWIPPAFGQSASLFPLHPYWGENRTFLSANAALPVPDIIAFSKDPGSDNYKLFREVYEKRYSLSEEEKRIAAWWADDPTETASPPGHSYNLATIAITSAQADIYTAAEAYAKVGMAVADAFICCWRIKYTYHSNRPLPYIRANIDANYQQFWPEPPFPAFSSGHATQSAAAASVLTGIFGENFPLVDNTYATRPPDFENIQYRSRNYRNIKATAAECAYSRFLGGIHTRQDNEVGAAQGEAIGGNVAGLKWKK